MYKILLTCLMLISPPFLYALDPEEGTSHNLSTRVVKAAEQHILGKEFDPNADTFFLTHVAPILQERKDELIEWALTALSQKLQCGDEMQATHTATLIAVALAWLEDHETDAARGGADDRLNDVNALFATWGDNIVQELTLHLKTPGLTDDESQHWADALAELCPSKATALTTHVLTEVTLPADDGAAQDQPPTSLASASASATSAGGENEEEKIEKEDNGTIDTQDWESLEEFFLETDVATLVHLVERMGPLLRVLRDDPHAIWQALEMGGDWLVNSGQNTEPGGVRDPLQAFITNAHQWDDWGDDPIGALSKKLGVDIPTTEEEEDERASESGSQSGDEEEGPERFSLEWWFSWVGVSWS